MLEVFTYQDYASMKSAKNTLLVRFGGFYPWCDSGLSQVSQSLDALVMNLKQSKWG